MGSDGGRTFITALIGGIAFALQIYFDFSGYSDMGIGLGRIFGLSFPENFNYPYISGSIKEFWRRWHMSLSSWFKDYVYIPLGGNRKGLFRQYLNIVIVWLLTGLWHVASWNFVAWGAYYALLLIIEKTMREKIKAKMSKVYGCFYTIFFVITGWVIFESSLMAVALSYIKEMFAFSYRTDIWTSQFYYMAHEYGFILVLGLILSTPLVYNGYSRSMGKLSLQTKKAVETMLIIFLYMGCIMRLVVSSYNPFIYFRF